MSTIEQLNDLYVRILKDENTLEKYEREIAGIRNHRHLSDGEKVNRTIAILSAIHNGIQSINSPIFTDIASAGKQYVSCLNAIGIYEQELLQLKSKGQDAVFRAADSVKAAQEGYDKIKDEIYSKYKIQLDSLESYLEISHNAIHSAQSSVEQKTEALKREAKSIVDKEYSTELKLTDPIENTRKLPDELLVARRPEDGLSYEILKSINVASVYRNLLIDLRNQGNVLLSIDYRDMEDTAIDEFIAAYVLRYVETFPLGAVNVHIFDDNTNYLFRRLANAFQSVDSGEETRRTVQIHTSYSDLESFDSVCNDIFKKTSVSKPDLYSVYETDRTDPFNLIILRDGLNTGGYSINGGMLGTISALTKPGSTGHKCGLRFLIVDNTGSDSHAEKKAAHLLDTIEENCCMTIRYEKDKGFTFDGKPVEALHITGDPDTYIQERSAIIAGAINKKEKNYITLDDVAAQTANNPSDNILTIPVGKAGETVVELPLSCKDTDGTVAGQCIGYMAIGQSGSGKSAFFHSLVLNACLKYSPKDLQFWLLDFKNGGASSKYSRSGIPHIRIIAENNKVDDALCLFQMVLEEMERRTRAFNKAFTDNIMDYNTKALEEGLEYFPRIIIAIDEVQEIFRDDNASVLQKLIASISTRMRSAGMHFIMVAQNLNDGKSYMLKEAFLPSAAGRVCFRVAPNIPGDSGYDEDFVQRKKEISELKTGEAYVSYGKGSIRKVKIAYISPKEMREKYFPQISAMYPELKGMKPLVIGSKSRLSVTAHCQETNQPYYEIIRSIKSSGGICRALIGEDVYRMSPFVVQFSQHENSSLLLLGSDRAIASSICTSIAVSLKKQKTTVHLFNADRTKLYDGNDQIAHPFLAVCHEATKINSNLISHRLNEFNDVMRDVYEEYLDRQDQVQKADFEDPEFQPVIIIVNDLFGIESFNNNEEVQNEAAEKTASSAEDPFGFGGHRDIFSDFSFSNNSSNTSGSFRAGLQDIMKTLAKNGYRYNMHVVLAIKGDPANWRTGQVSSLVSNMILFNETEYTDQLSNSYYLREMLKNISDETGNETLAVWAGKGSYSKIRPVIYDLSDRQENAALDALVKER